MTAPIVRRISLWAPPVIYMAAIFSLSADPDPPAPASISDKLMHLMAYAVLAVLVFRAVTGGLPARVTRWSAVITLLITSVYAISDELHQVYVPGRTADVNDLYADVAGAALALIGCWAWGIIQIPNPKSQIPNPKAKSQPGQSRG